MTGASDEISEETRLLAERVRLRAAGMPTESDLAGMTAEALSRKGGPMTTAQISAIAAEALEASRQLAERLAHLAELLSDRPGEI